MRNQRFHYISIGIFLICLSMSFLNCGKGDPEVPVNEIFNEATETNKMKIEYSYRVGFNPMPLGVSPLEILYKNHWLLENINFEQKIAVPVEFEDALNYTDMTTFLTFFNKYIEVNSSSPFDEKRIYAFGVDNIIENIPANAIGFTLGS